MTVVAIYNNKGGEGKSTVTVGLAEFLAGNLNKKVLVIDLDAQGSSSCSLLGRVTLATAVDEGRGSAPLLAHVRARKRRLKDVERYLVWRAGTDARGSSLGELGVLVPDGPQMFELEEELDWKKDHSLMRRYVKPALESFDYVLIDMPANVTKSSVFCVNGLVMSDFILVPTKPTHISLGGLPRTFEMIHYVQDLNGNGRPAILGFLRNATDKRFQQYKANFPAIIETSKSGELPPVFDNHWPPSPALESATDENRDYQTLRERFGKSYDHARKVARELETRCRKYNSAHPPAPIRRSIWQRLGLS